MDKRHLQERIEYISSQLNDVVFAKVFDAINKNPGIRINLNPAFPFPNLLRIGILKNNFVIEYVGPEAIEESKLNIEGLFKPEFDVFDFLNMDLKHVNTNKFSLSDNVENTAFFLGDSIAYLCDYFYDITQMPSEYIFVNGYIDLSSATRPVFISNTTFFWTNNQGELKIKHIDFMEIIPINQDGEILYHDSSGLDHFADFIINYKVPTYRIELHKVLNEFIELINFQDTTETQITKFLEDNPEILQFAFGAHTLNPQLTLEWQFRTDKNNLKPDFMPIKMDGFADILEFKLPNLKSDAMVGSNERYHPSFEIDSAIAQIDCYEEWCSQEINRVWLEKEKGIKVLNPRRTLVIGHSKDFSPEDRRKLRSIRNTTVFTYDEFIDLARHQIYRIR